MDFEFETTRPGLANAFAEAGAKLLSYQPLVSAAVAAIPDTQPQKYAIAGTLPGILQMAGKMMGEDAAEKPTGDLTDAQIIETMAKYSRFLEPGLYSQTDFDCPEDMISFARDIERAANAAHFERQAQAEPLTVKVERNRVWIVRGNQSFMLDYAADEGDDPAEIEWYANQLRAVLSGFTPDVKIAVPSAAALRDEVRTQHDEILALHRRLAAETMRADDGWRRADAKSRECIELRERMAAPASQEGAHAAQWISVDERLPEPETDVLIIRLGQIRVGAIFIEHESWEEGGREIHYWDDSNDDGQGWDWYEVTHWMPLPPAPALQTPAIAERSGDGSGTRSFGDGAVK